MPKIKVPRSSPSLDMTPMVDLAFLLVTFFMLTTQFRASEPVTVDMPKSQTDKLLPENTLMVTVDTAGRAFFNISGNEVRRKMLTEVGSRQKPQITFTDEELQRFSIMTSFGVPIKDMKKYIMMSEGERARYNLSTKGIPMDSLNNELSTWILAGRRSAAIYAKEVLADDPESKVGRELKDLRIAIKADGKADYFKVRKVMKVFEDQEVYRFNLITNLESE